MSSYLDHLTTGEPDGLVDPTLLLSLKPELADSWSPVALELFCRATSEQIEKREIRRKVQLQAHTAEEHWGNGEFELRMDHAPIVSVEAVRFRGSAIQGVTIANKRTGLLHNPARWSGVPAYERKVQGVSDPISADPFLEDFYPSGDGSPPWEVDYTAGLDPVPADLILAAAQMAIWGLRSAENLGITSETIGSYSYTADKAFQEQPFVKLIRSYRIRQGWRR